MVWERKDNPRIPWTFLFVALVTSLTIQEIAIEKNSGNDFIDLLHPTLGKGKCRE